MTRWAYLDGKAVAKDRAFVRCLDEGFLYGQGLFETMRCYKGQVFVKRRHIARLRRSCRLLGLKAPALSLLNKALDVVVTKNRLKEACLRLNVFMSGSKSLVFVFARRLCVPTPLQYERGYRARLFKDEHIGASVLNSVKRLDRSFFMRLARRADREGFQEALFLNSAAHVVEGSRTNIFFVRDQVVSTPALFCGCLPGITREVVIALLKRLRIPCLERAIPWEEAYQQDEAFLTNSLLEVMPLTRIGKRLVAGGRIGPVTKEVMQVYKEEVEKQCRIR